MSIASVPSSFREQQFHGFQQREQSEQHCEQQQQQQQYTQQQLLDSVNRHKERVLTASLRVEVLECQIREEVEKLFSLIASSSSSCSSSHPIVSISSPHHTIDKDDSNIGSSSSCCSHSNVSNCSSQRTINRDDYINTNNPNIHQLEANILQLENDLLTEQRTLAEYEKLYQVSLERTKQRWKQQIEEHQRRFRVCYRAVPHHSRSESL